MVKELETYEIAQEIKDRIKELELAKIEIQFKSCQGAIMSEEARKLREITQELRKLYRDYKVEPVLGDDIWAKKQDWEGFID